MEHSDRLSLRETFSSNSINNIQKLLQYKLLLQYSLNYCSIRKSKRFRQQKCFQTLIKSKSISNISYFLLLIFLTCGLNLSLRRPSGRPLRLGWTVHSYLCGPSPPATSCTCQSVPPAQLASYCCAL